MTLRITPWPGGRRRRRNYHPSRGASLRALGSEPFAEGLAVRAQREREAVATVAAARDAQGILAPGKRDHWEARWPAMSVIERRATMAALIDSAMVARGAGSVAGRVSIRSRGCTEPLAPPVPNPRWEERRIEQELRESVVDGWPHDEEFIAAGRGPLLREIHASGGPARWARRIGSGDPPSRARGFWTDDRIRGALTVLMADRCTWPSRRELTAIGYDGLYGAMRRRGHRVWEHEFGFGERPGVVTDRRGPKRA
jgi:hypothetical protein